MANLFVVDITAVLALGGRGGRGRGGFGHGGRARGRALPEALEKR